MVARRTGPSPEVVDAVLERAAFTCEICDHMIGDRRGVDYSIHHRRARKMGGTRWTGINLPSNLMVLCGSGNRLCHGDVESYRATAAGAGYLVLSFCNPAEVAVLLHKERWVYLTDDAQYSDAPPERAA